jgi:hypothetical protein
VAVERGDIAHHYVLGCAIFPCVVSCQSI